MFVSYNKSSQANSGFEKPGRKGKEMIRFDSLKNNVASKLTFASLGDPVTIKHGKTANNVKTISQKNPYVDRYDLETLEMVISLVSDFLGLKVNFQLHSGLFSTEQNKRTEISNTSWDKRTQLPKIRVVIESKIKNIFFKKIFKKIFNEDMKKHHIMETSDKDLKTSSKTSPTLQCIIRPLKKSLKLRITQSSRPGDFNNEESDSEIEAAFSSYNEDALEKNAAILPKFNFITKGNLDSIQDSIRKGHTSRNSSFHIEESKLDQNSRQRRLDYKT
ncbi:unnamed protein product [Moneuplotes crassus]|uniref:Uncharacterized protein n=1 Tax=Euplotes crassus TaxID=5936 RepID=A0AAD1Y9E0_EUPCR|nr:unnamed protein product [Moneuplotes crassus]